ncbi:unnamed protein product, partial [marine sediment metagenome]
MRIALTDLSPGHYQLKGKISAHHDEPRKFALGQILEINGAKLSRSFAEKMALHFS